MDEAWSKLDVIAPNFKRRLSGVTTTVLRLVPIQAKAIGIASTGPGLPPEVPQVPLWRVLLMPRDRVRVWHARRNNEMVFGVFLRGVLRKRLKLVFTSAAQRHHTGFTKWLIARQDVVIATSDKAAGYLDRASVVIPHGVDTAIFSPLEDRAALRAGFGIPEGAVVIGCFGRIRHQKGIDLLVRAAMDLMADRPDLMLVLSGRVTRDNAAYKADLDAQIAARGLGARIRFLGEVSWADLVSLQRAVDLYVAPSRWEGFGLTPLEAMACGTPVVASDAGAYRQIVEGSGCGTIVPPGDEPALRAAIRDWLDAPGRLRAIRPACRQHVLRAFPIELEARRVIEVYRGLIGQKGA